MKQVRFAGRMLSVESCETCPFYHPLGDFTHFTCGADDENKICDSNSIHPGLIHPNCPLEEHSADCEELFIKAQHFDEVKLKLMKMKHWFETDLLPKYKSGKYSVGDHLMDNEDLARQKVLLLNQVSDWFENRGKSFRKTPKRKWLPVYISATGLNGKIFGGDNNILTHLIIQTKNGEKITIEPCTCNGELRMVAKEEHGIHHNDRLQNPNQHG